MNRSKDLKKLRAKVEQMKGKPFTVISPNGTKYRLVVKEVRGDKVLVRAARRTKGPQTQFHFFSFLFPLLFFFPFFGGFNGFGGLSGLD